MRIHGIRMHNFLRYGEHHNVVEFDKGAARFLASRGSFTSLERQSMHAEAQKYLQLWLDDKSRHVVSIIGKTDGDRRRSNGAGKSSIFDAISFAFYQKLIREVIRKDKDRDKGKSTVSIIRENTDGNRCSEAFVEVLFSANNALWLLRRGRKSSSQDKHSAIFRLDCLSSPEFAHQGSRTGHRLDDTEDALSKLIKMDFETFCNSILFGQFDSGQFLHGTDKVRKDIIINILQLGVIDEYLEAARTRKAAINSSIESVQAQITVLLEKAPIDSVEALRLIGVAKERITNIDAETKTLESEVSDLRKTEGLVKFESAKTEADLKQKLYDQKKSEFTSQLSGISTKKSEAETRLKDVKESLTNRRTERQSLEDGLAGMRTNLANIDIDVIKQQLEYVQKAKTAKPERSKQYTDALEVISKLQFALGGQQNKIKGYEDEIERLERLLKTGGTVICPTCKSTVDAKHLRTEIEKLEKELVLETTQLKKMQSNLKASEDACGDIKARLTAIDEYLAKETWYASQLSNHTNLQQTIKTAESNLLTYDKSLLPDIEKSIRDEEAEVKKLTTEYDKLSGDINRQLDPLETEAKNAAKKIGDWENIARTTNTRIANLTSSITILKTEGNGKHQEIGRLENQIVESQANQTKIQDLQGDLAKHHQTMNRIKILEQMYGDSTKTCIVEKYIPLLNSYLQEYLEMVAGGHMHASIVTDGKKEGKVDIEITGESASVTTGCSGGEQVRLRLALSIALGLLSFARTKEMPEFILFDEVISPVDLYTKDLIFPLLARLQEHFRMIMIVSHDPVLQMNIRREIVVNKQRGISRIERQFWEETNQQEKQ